MQWSIDINCDMGESEDQVGLDRDIRLLGYVSSVNIACGFHAGNEHVMRTLIRECKRNNVCAGAHPSFDDRTNFGRIEVDLSADEIYHLVSKQLSIIGRIAHEEGVQLHHVKPHGALYNMAAKDAGIAAAIALSVADHESKLVFVGLAGSCLITEGLNAGLKVSREAFADRRYEPDATLRSRKKEGAMFSTAKEMFDQVLMICREQKVIASDGSAIRVDADSVCIHSDGEHALRFASDLKAQLLKNNITIQSISFK